MSISVFPPASADKTSVDTFAAPGVGPWISAGNQGLTNFSLAVVGTGGLAAKWVLTLEVSLDGVKPTDLIKHTDLIGDGVILASAGNAPVLFYRVNCSVLTLGLASNVVATVVGKAG